MVPFFKRHTLEQVLAFLVSLVLVAALFLLAVVLMRAAWGMYGRFADAALGQEASAQKLFDMEKRRAKVEGALQDLSTTRGMEAALRERYGVAKEGEGVVEIVGEETIQTTASPQKDQSLFRSLLPW